VVGEKASSSSGVVQVQVWWERELSQEPVVEVGVQVGVVQVWWERELSQEPVVEVAVKVGIWWTVGVVYHELGRPRRIYESNDGRGSEVRTRTTEKGRRGEG